jgi:arginase
VNHFRCIGAAVGASAGIPGCEAAPELLRAKLPYVAQLWEKTIVHSAAVAQDTVGNLERFSWQLATLTKEVLRADATFITFGGDHSCAIGTWSGVQQVHPEFGLLWIDAHMDAHTPQTSPSGNFHGMPVACLLGRGETRLTSIASAAPKVKPHNLAMIGIRSFEEGEATLLRDLGVRIYMMEEVAQRGFSTCVQEILVGFSCRGLPYGISFDVDSLDPRDFSATGTPSADGIRLASLIAALELVDYAKLIGIEFAEYNPRLDTQEYAGVRAIDQILHHIPGLISLPLAAAN